MKTIFFGNGINLLNKYSTWDDLLRKIAVEKGEDKIPNILQFEAEVLPLPEKITEPVTFNGEPVTYNDEAVTWTISSEISLKTEIAEAMEKYESNDVYRRIAELPDVSHYVTTNYDDVLKRTLEPIGYKEQSHVRIESTYSLRRRVTLANSDGNQKHIWNIHGEIASPQTIMLGLHQYCGSVGKIKDYLDGNYAYTLDKKEITQLNIQERLNTGIDEPFSWIDLFFITDVFIIGFGLLYEEIDLWWVLTRRKRLIRQGATITNHIYYCGNVDSGKKQLLQTMGVDIIGADPKAVGYTDKYHSMLDKIEKM